MNKKVLCTMIVLSLIMMTLLNNIDPVRGNPLVKSVCCHGNTPPDPPQIEGPITCNMTEKTNYYITITDPDEGDRLVELFVLFGDGTNVSVKYRGSSCCKGWGSGTILTVGHRWMKPGNYTIKARVMDYFRNWGDWGYLGIHIAKNKAVAMNPVFQGLIELLGTRFPRFRTFFSLNSILLE